MIKLKSLILEIYPPSTRFGLGGIDCYGAVDFKEFSRDTFDNQIHGRGGNPSGRYTFRYVGGVVDWSDGHPPQEIKNIVETYLERRGYTVKKHKTYYDQFGPQDDIDESILLESRFRGEWWFQDGQAVYADGDVGDMNHEMYVTDTLRSQVLNELGVDLGNYDRPPDFSDVSNEIFENIKDELTPQEIEDWGNDEYNDVIISYLTRKGEKNINEIIYYLRGHDERGKTLDLREYALVHWGWQRVKGNVIQTQTLTSTDLQHIVRGLYEAYTNELDDMDDERKSETNPLGEPTFNIEVMSTRSWYEDVPISLLEKKNPMSLNQFKSRY